MIGSQPLRGEVWLVNLDPTRGHEQAGRRPALIVSADPFNYSPAGLAIAVPITSKGKGIPWHIEINPPEGGLKQKSFIKCEDVRSLASERLIQRYGIVTAQTLLAVDDLLRILLDL